MVKENELDITSVNRFEVIDENGSHKTSSGIGSSTLSTATHLINCTALTYTTETAIGFMRC